MLCKVAGEAIPSVSSDMKNGQEDLPAGKLDDSRWRMTFVGKIHFR